MKSVGIRERTEKSGKVVKYSGNDHYLKQCLKEYDQNFSFSAITVPARTLPFLPEGGQAVLEAKGLIIEKTASGQFAGSCLFSISFKILAQKCQ